MMESGYVTTPFGRRSLTLGMLASQVVAREIEPHKTVDKWKLFRALCEAKPLLGVTDRALAVLNALLSFYPKADLSQDNGLIVFPSNMQLSLRTHGMAETSLRRHLASLVEAGLLIRKDSPNGKRYARKDRSGDIDAAFGFSLAPLLARSEEIENLAATVMAERLHLMRLRERLTLCRRDITKLIAAALDEGAAGDWQRVHAGFRALVMALPRAPNAVDVAATLGALEDLRENIVNQLEMQIKDEIHTGNAGQNERHIQNSKSDSHLELEPAPEQKQVANPVTGEKLRPETARSFPLGMIVAACPDIVAYGPSGAISSWRDLMAAAIVVRSMLGVSPSAYQSACEILGPENAAAVMACILERGGQINSAGGYLRDLTRRAERGEFSLGPMIMALMRTHGQPDRRAG